MSQAGILKISSGSLPPDVPTTFVTDSGNAVPVANVLNVLGQQAGTIPVMATSGSGNTVSVENRAWITSFVVDPSATVGLRGTFTTIQAAITAASPGTTIYIRPGSYVENLTMKEGITLCSMSGDSNNNLVQIFGSITCTYAGISSITGCKLVPTTAGGIILSGASATELYVKDCVIFSFGGSGSNYCYTSSNAAKTGHFINCSFDTDAFGSFFNMSAGQLDVITCLFSPNTGGSVIANTISGGTFNFQNSIYGNDNILHPPWTISGGACTFTNSSINGVITTSGTSTLEVDNCRCFSTAAFFTLGGTSHNIFGCEITSGSGSAISVSTIATVSQCTILSTATNPITGAGTVIFSGITFTGSGATSTINTTTQAPSVRSNDALKVVTPGAYPYTTVPQDALILVDSSSARTIIPRASPVSGQTYIIKDNGGLAGTNNITITPSGQNIDGAASTSININYGSVTIVYNGSQWNII
jgi:hypothetical protein